MFIHTKFSERELLSLPPDGPMARVQLAVNTTNPLIYVRAPKHPDFHKW